MIAEHFLPDGIFLVCFKNFSIIYTAGIGKNVYCKVTKSHLDNSTLTTNKTYYSGMTFTKINLKRA